MSTNNQNADAFVNDAVQKNDDQFMTELSQRNQMDEEDLTPVSAPRGPFSCITRCVHKVMPPGGIVASAFSLAGGTIGAGILGLPAGTNACGVITSMILLTYVTVLTIFSLRMLSIVASKSGIKSFEGLTRWLFPQGHYAFSYFSAFIRWFFSFGCCIGYVISVMDLFKPIFDESLKRSETENKALVYFASANGRRLIAFLVWLVFMVPLVIPRHIDTLRFASFLAIMFMVYFCIIIIVHSCLNGLKIHKNNVVISGPKTANDGAQIFLFRSGNSAVSDLGTFCFSYICQVNAVEVFWDMRPEVRTVNGFTKAGALGIMICTIIYIMVSIFGYFDFGAEKLATNSMLLMYNPLDEPEVMVAYIGVLIKLIVAYALLHIGCRNSVYYCIGWTEKYKVVEKPQGGGDQPR
ncbi:Transmembrane amino acid transporter protein/Tryptophan/tyrosine permease family, putative [Angomonas deanei]|uniref:Transmembrane amino acid transporter protein/Tryptophan/tyrosine permease family, putative n=1 Tax=Angomonas deanei TaxID=59799 RepID=A0A7G2CJ58_9TRYP|nr:Transmembrane amino acid transporter protein/Tryptophan/tyrosine permease family, putative [Angomonas deanei]